MKLHLLEDTHTHTQLSGTNLTLVNSLFSLWLRAAAAQVSDFDPLLSALWGLHFRCVGHTYSSLQQVDTQISEILTVSGSCQCMSACTEQHKGPWMS